MIELIRMRSVGLAQGSPGATLGATRADDLGMRRTDSDERAARVRACGLTWTGAMIVWESTDQKVRGSNPFGRALWCLTCQQWVYSSHYMP